MRIRDEQPAAPTSAGARTRPPLPAGLWIVALLLAVSGVLLVLAAAGVTSTAAARLLGRDESFERPLLVGAIGVGQLVAALGLVLRERIARALALLLVGIGLAAQLAAYVRGDVDLAPLALYVAMAFYLNQRSVREVFAESGTTDAT